MDNNQNNQFPNNQFQNNAPQQPDGYRNFNEYQTQAQPEAQPQNTYQAPPQAPYQAPPLPQAQYYNYTAQPQNESKTYGILSIVFGVCGCCCCGLSSIVGVILGIIGVKKNKDDVLSIVGLVISALLTAYLLYAMINIVVHYDEFIEYVNNYMEQYNEIMEQYMEQSMEQAMENMENLESVSGSSLTPVK